MDGKSVKTIIVEQLGKSGAWWTIWEVADLLRACGKPTSENAVATRLSELTSAGVLETRRRLRPDGKCAPFNEWSSPKGRADAQGRMFEAQCMMQFPE